MVKVGLGNGGEFGSVCGHNSDRDANWRMLAIGENIDTNPLVG